MSVRAYKLIEVKHAPLPTFNCWHDQDIFDLAENIEQYNENGGILTFHDTEVLDKMDELKRDINKTPEKQETLKKLQQILQDMDGENYVDYYCF